MSSFLPQKPLDEELLKNAFAFMEQRCFAPAFLILSDLKSSERADIQFALGICHINAEEYDIAAGYFEQSLTALKRLNPAGSAMAKTDTYRVLRRKEIAESLYLQPFTMQTATQFFDITKENIILALAESCVKSGNIAKAKTLLNSLNGDEFKDIKARI